MDSFLKGSKWDRSKRWVPTFGKKQFRLVNEEKDQYIKISSKEDLLKFRDQVNQGDGSYVEGEFILKVDIDLNGMKWKTIGLNEF